MRHGWNEPFDTAPPTRTEREENIGPSAFSIDKISERDPEKWEHDLKVSRLIVRLMEAQGKGLDAEHENRSIPAGYTYLGQLITHDLTFSSTISISDPASGFTFRNYNTPSLDLDCIYRGGPEKSPLLYEIEDHKKPYMRKRLRLGYTTPKNDQKFSTSQREDLGRFCVSTCTSNLADHLLLSKSKNLCPHLESAVGDLRNEDNLILSQLTVLFHKLHNHYVSESTRLYPNENFHFHFSVARFLTTKSYHNIIINDYLRRILSDDVYTDYISDSKFVELPFNDIFFDERKSGALPLEFTKAAMRFGHVMVRKTYFFNEAHSTSSINLLMKFNSEGSVEKPRVPITTDWIIDWPRFFPALNPDGSVADCQDYVASRSIAPAITSALTGSQLFEDEDLATDSNAVLDPTGGVIFRDLVRGMRSALPTGQALSALLFGRPTLENRQIYEYIHGVFQEKLPDLLSPELTDLIENLSAETPLLYYILLESDLIEDGTCLGKLGSTIIAEVILEALRKTSYDLGGVISANEDDILNAISPPKTVSQIVALCGN